MIQSPLKLQSCWTLIALVGIVWGLLPAIAHAAAPPARLPALVAEASDQFQLAYRSQPAEGERRQEQLEAVVNAWRAAPRSEVNNQRLSNWLRAAIRSSMPGSHEELPAAPSFASSGEREKRPMEPTTKSVRAPEPTPPIESLKPAADDAHVDPFRDDPIDKPESK
ncbi:MAG TPA: hypothetical protein VHU84_05910 [Lacipirellulaceae bacterium]|jgi:hypothetical protein|nr:hypothetical protein [Lacipirellulaceae bacterium]